MARSFVTYASWTSILVAASSAMACGGSSNAGPGPSGQSDAGGPFDGSAPPHDASGDDASDAGATSDAGSITPQPGALATGGASEFLVRPDQTILHWGAPFDALGSVVRTPEEAVHLTGAIAVAASGMTAMALLASGEVRAWGINRDLGLGDGNAQGDRTVTVPVAVKLAGPASFLAASGGHSCAVLATGDVQCWGMELLPVLHETATPTTVALPKRAVAVAVSDGHCCALLTTGEIACWGENGHGQIGDGTTTSPPAPVLVQGVSNATMVSAGGAHTCAVLASGALQCWGSNGSGELGNGSMATGDSPLPHDVTGISNAVAVAAGTNHSCALLRDGTVECWGSNAEGQIAAPWGGGTAPHSTPGAVAGVTSAVGINAGDRHACALLANGDVECWGDNQYGQLGNGSADPSFTNVAVKVVR